MARRNIYQTSREPSPYFAELERARSSATNRPEYDEIGRQGRLSALDELEAQREEQENIRQAERKKRELEERTAEDAYLKKLQETDREARDRQAKIVDETPQEYIFPAGRKPALNKVPGIYQTEAARPESAEELKGFLGGFSNIGVRPGRSTADIRQEQEYLKALELAGIKAGDKKTPSDEGIITQIKGKQDRIKAIQDSVADPAEKEKNIQAVQGEIKDLQSLLDRGKTIRPLDSYRLMPGETVYRTGASGQESVMRGQEPQPDKEEIPQPPRGADQAFAKIRQLVANKRPEAQKAVELFKREFPQFARQADSIIRPPRIGVVGEAPAVRPPTYNIPVSEPAAPNMTIRELATNPPRQGVQTAQDYIKNVQNEMTRGNMIDFESFKKGFKSTVNGLYATNDKLLELYKLLWSGLNTTGNAILDVPVPGSSGLRR